MKRRVNIIGLIPNKSGFTLIEVISVIVIIGIISGITVLIIFHSADALSNVSIRKDNLQNAKLAMEIMAREIRAIKTATETDIITFTSTNFKFRDSDDNVIEYSISGTDLYRNTSKLTENVQSIEFLYKKKDGTAASNASEIWYVIVKIVVQTGSQSYTLRTTIFPRNFASTFTSWKET